MQISSNNIAIKDVKKIELHENCIYAAAGNGVDAYFRAKEDNYQSTFNRLKFLLKQESMNEPNSNVAVELNDYGKIIGADANFNIIDDPSERVAAEHLLYRDRVTKKP